MGCLGCLGLQFDRCSRPAMGLLCRVHSLQLGVGLLCRPHSALSVFSFQVSGHPQALRNPQNHTTTMGNIQKSTYSRLERPKAVSERSCPFCGGLVLVSLRRCWADVGGFWESSWSQVGPKTVQDGATTGQVGAKMAQDGAKTAQDGAKMG